jgi:simple sugar transport system ATP-binding protein
MNDARPPDPSQLLSLRGISKRFGAVRALRSVDLDIGSNEVVALLGDNGAGKSTLIKILTGVHQPDSGKILWKGQPLQLRSPRDAYECGIGMVYQDLGLVDQLSIYRNLFLGREREITRGIWPIRWLDRSGAQREARAALERLHIELRSMHIPVEMLSGGQRQSIAIARGVHFDAELLILDEPTSAMSLRQTAEVLKSIERARDAGTTVLVISHNVRQIFAIADRFAILSQGESIGSLRRDECTVDQIADLMTGGKTPEKVTSSFGDDP